MTSNSSSLRWRSTGITLAGTVAQSGTSATQFYYPHGLTFDSTFSALYVSDWSNNRIQRISIGAPTCQTVAGQSSGLLGNSSIHLSIPSDIIFDSNDNMYIADPGNARVQFWSNGASSGDTIAGVTGKIECSSLMTNHGDDDRHVGSRRSSSSQLNGPYGLARDTVTETIYIGESSNHRIIRYLANATSGTVVAGRNGSGTARNQLFGPHGIYFDRLTNSFYIANAAANNVVKWTIGDDQWTLVAGSADGVAGNTSTLLKYPTDVTLDATGNVCVADRLNNRIQLFPRGQFEGITLAGVTGVTGNASNLLYRPHSITFDSQFNLYVSDMWNHRIQLFLRY